jgi:25S rRNA (cytosine2278-C5)-methyltransferase
MALYYDASSILASPASSEGSLRSRIYNSSTPIKSSPPLLYGLITECAKWDAVLSEVIDNAGIISQEPKV